MKRALRLAFGLAAFGLLVLFNSWSASAQDWMLKSSLSQRLSYNSNLLLTPDNSISAFGSQTTPDLTLSRSGPTTDVSLEGRFRFSEYFNHSDLNSQDQYGKLRVSKDLSERSSVLFIGDIDHDTTLESDQDVSGEFVDKAIRFVAWDANPSWQYALSPIDRLRVAASYKAVNYSSSEKTDYKYYGPTVSYFHDISELATVNASLSYSRFEADDDENRRTDTYGGLIGYDYHPTERFSVSAAGGLNYNVDHEDDTGTEGDIGYQFQLNLDYQISDQTKTTLLLSRDTEPTGDGEVRTRNRASLNFNYEMTETTSFNVVASYLDDQRTQSETTASQWFSLSPGVEWDLTDSLSLEATYRFRYKTVDSRGSAMDNGAFITLNYAFPDVHWSGL